MQTVDYPALTAREIVQNLQNLLQGGRQGEDVRLSDRQWLFNLDHHRAQLLRQQAEKGQQLNEQNVQKLLVTVPRQACGTWYAAAEVPAAIEAYQQNLYTFIGTSNGHAFQESTHQRAEWEKFARFTSRSPKYYFLGRTLHLLTPPNQADNVVEVHGLFENPREVLVYNKATLDPLDYLNFPYPLSRTALDTILKLLVDGELRLLLTLPADRVNDGRELHEGGARG